MQPDNAVVMKGGPHAGAAWGQIVEGKLAELARSGLTLWGYGGSVCHPTRQVQPFADMSSDVAVAMIPTVSDPGNAPSTTSEWSRDSLHWEPLPDGLRVTGSKWALVLDRLERCDDEIDLSRYVVAVGAQKGRSASGYLRHRVDKGCFTRSGSDEPPRHVPVVLRGRLATPYAVFLR